MTVVRNLLQNILLNTLHCYEKTSSKRSECLSSLLLLLFFFYLFIFFIYFFCACVFVFVCLFLFFDRSLAF